MIPPIEDIVAGLLNGTFTREQAVAWLLAHNETALESDDGVAKAFVAMRSACENTLVCWDNIKNALNAGKPEFFGDVFLETVNGAIGQIKDAISAGDHVAVETVS